MSKRLTTVLMTAALAGTVVSGALPAAALADTGSQLQVQESYGTWERSGGRWWFATQGGGYLSDGLWYISGQPYVFDKNGWLYTNTWIKLSDGMWYWCEPSGVVARGWRNLGGTWYYLDPADDGSMVIGWRMIDGTWYRFLSSGAMACGWQQVAGDWYYFDGSGAMRTGWLASGGYWYYFGTDGRMLTGWHTIGGKRFCFSEFESNSTPLGGMLTGVVRIGDTSEFYFFYEDGTMARNEWVDTGKYGTIYFGSDGIGTPGQ